MKYTQKFNWQQKSTTKKTRVKFIEGTYGLVTTYDSERTTRQLLDHVQVDIDIDEVIKQIAAKAAHNNSGRATQLHGLIKAKRISRNVLSETKEQFPIPKGVR